MAKRDLTKIPGTIAYLFTQHTNDFNQCGNNINKMKEVALRLLDDPNLTDKEAVMKAKKNLGASNNSRFLSLLTTYMTGEKVN